MWRGSRRQSRTAKRRALGWLIGGLLLVHLPRSVLCVPVHEPGQLPVLARIDEMEARCQEQGVSGERAREVLEPLAIPLAPRSFNGWQLLRGASHPQVLSVEEARRRLGSREPVP